MKNLLLAILVLFVFSACNKTKIDKCCTCTPQIVYVDSSFIAMPDLFTPNGDGINDQLQVITKNIVSLECSIKKKFENVVYSWTDVNGYWDGKYNGKNQREKAYFYTIEATTTSGNTLSLSGNIGVIRDNCAKGDFEKCFFGTQFNYFTNSFDGSLPSYENINVCNW